MTNVIFEHKEYIRPPEVDFVPEIQMLKPKCACQNVGNSSFWNSFERFSWSYKGDTCLVQQPNYSLEQAKFG